MYKKSLLIVILVFLNTDVLGMNIIPSNSAYYYDLGGGSDISMPPVTDHYNMTVGGKAYANLDFTCDGFNPSVSINNTFNDIKDSLEGLEQDILNSATAAVGTMPLYLVEKSDKDLYNFFQNTIEDGKDTFNFSLKSCQDALNNINQDKSPYRDWFSVSDSQGWVNYSDEAKQGQNVDINSAKTEIAKDPEKYGVPWVHPGENSGGTVGSQVPINVIYDVVVAGYNVMIDPQRPLDSKDAAPTDSELARFWATPDEAGKWSQLVLGDITISSDENKRDTNPGVGLVPILRTCPPQANNDLTCVKTLQQNLANIVNSGSYPTSKDLESVSSNETMITPQVISTIHNLNNEEQGVTISKIGEDVAIQNLVDEALLLRRILLAGSQTKPVHNLKPALATIRTTISDLDKDVQDLLFENQVKKQMMTDTLQTVLGRAGSAETSALTEHDQTQEPELKHGATYDGGRKTEDR
jgi:integrating conjugative element protein (TIGR03755 family)